MSEFMAEVAALDTSLAISMGELRAAIDRGTIDPRSAADLRITLLRNHLAQVSAARLRHFGEPGESQ